MEEASWLERLFKESEVLDVVKGMNNEKAPPLWFFYGIIPSMLGGDQARYSGGVP